MYRDVGRDGKFKVEVGGRVECGHAPLLQLNNFTEMDFIAMSFSAIVYTKRRRTVTN